MDDLIFVISMIIFTILVYYFLIRFFVNLLFKKPEIKPSTNLIQEDVISALHTLGYNKRLATNIVLSIPNNNLSVEKLLREALNKLQPARTVINIKDSVVQRTNFNSSTQKD